MDVRSLMRRAAGFNADREALVHGEARLTFAEAWERGLRLANGLLALGLQPGDRVGVLEDNCLSAGDAFLGLGAANLVRVPLYPRNSREGHLHMLGHTGCRALLVTGNHAASVAGIEADLPALEHVLVRDASYEGWLASHSATDPDPPVSPGDWYIIRHTAGTTGRSKGVAYSHKAWLDTGRDWFYAWPPVEPGDRCLHIGPISHGSGYLFTPVWLAGGANHMVDHFDPGACLELMERERISFLFAVPTILSALARHPGARGRDWSALKVINVGGSPISDDTALLSHEIFGDCLYQIYGQTEALPATMMGPKEWFSTVPGSTPLRSAGRPLPFADLAIVDEAGNPVATGELGEIAVRKDGQMVEFWENPEATAERLVGGFVLTGDIGRLDANGYVYVLDRKDDMIISGGFNIWPAELENVLMDHPAVVEVAVFGIPDPRWGETPMAICQTDGATAVTEAELVALCLERLGSYKKPSRVVLQRDPLPHTPVGKLARKQLREPYWEGVDRRVAGS
ncbi:MAG TPA: AMP-binding protein [Candidatus Dormibacteraeota bacterium]|nr:AMP-binding protein [Candidatus Dormibacteraeota bacterium]